MKGAGGKRFVQFSDSEGVLIQTSDTTRQWRAKKTKTGWYRLSFKDVGDLTWTNAGLHPDLETAKHEARRR